MILPTPLPDVWAGTSHSRSEAMRLGASDVSTGEATTCVQPGRVGPSAPFSRVTQPNPGQVNHMPRIEPLHSNIVVEEHALGEVSKGGLLLPQIAKASTPYRYATVVAVGPGRYAADGRLVPCSCKVGDTIAFAKGQGVEFPLDDADGNEKVYRLLNEQFVLGVMHDMPVVSRLSGLDGRLLTMNPASRAPSDGAVEQLDRVARARVDGIIDSAGGTLDAMVDADRADLEME